MAERGWVVVHSDEGAILIAAFYRPPRLGETDTLRSMADEFRKHNGDVIGSYIVGEFNVITRCVSGRW